jgi:phosphohistidine phosphatase
VILYFLRHGPAGDPRPERDDERPLTDAGVAELTAAAFLWRRLNLRPDAVISSPFARARQTAELFVAGIGRGTVTTDDGLVPGAGWPEMGRALARVPEARRVLFVGHEPDLSNAIATLTGAASVRMRKGAVACVEFPGAPEPGTGELAWLIDPDLYRD